MPVGRQEDRKARWNNTFFRYSKPVHSDSRSGDVVFDGHYVQSINQSIHCQPAQLSNPCYAPNHNHNHDHKLNARGRNAKAKTGTITRTGGRGRGTGWGSNCRRCNLHSTNVDWGYV
ncbi:hypothetical protein BDV06DRAFT_92419 [Aspergillus oleicola]